MVKKLFFIATLLYIGATASAENYQVKSPDGRIVAELNTCLLYTSPSPRD